MEFPLRYVWFSSTFLILGGGSTVVNACLTMILTDATPAASRSRVFLYFTASNLGSEVIAPPIVSYFIDSNPWVPLVIGLCCTGLTVSIAASVPETLSPKRKSAEAIDNPDGPTEEDVLHPTEVPAKDSLFKATIKHMLQSLNYIKSQHALFRLVCVFMISDFARQSMLFLVQYVSVRYRLTLGQVSVAAVLCFALGLPGARQTIYSRGEQRQP